MARSAALKKTVDEMVSASNAPAPYLAVVKIPKCPTCGASNPEGRENCPACGDAAPPTTDHQVVRAKMSIAVLWATVLLWIGAQLKRLGTWLKGDE